MAITNSAHRYFHESPKTSDPGLHNTVIVASKPLCNYYYYWRFPDHWGTSGIALEIRTQGGEGVIRGAGLAPTDPPEPPLMWYVLACRNWEPLILSWVASFYVFMFHCFSKTECTWEKGRFASAIEKNEHSSLLCFSCEFFFQRTKFIRCKITWTLFEAW